MSAVGTLLLTARMTRNDPPRKPPIWGIRLVSIAQIAASGASGTLKISPTVSTNRPISAATVSDPPK